jgi:A/G-specific adenine glycosylase
MTLSPFLRKRLLDWFERTGRVLPWRAEPREPYAVWLSEIMLQQTRVDTVIPYFQNFLTRWPTVSALAAASDDDVMAAWAGLGYYRRARNLLACARLIAGRHGGRFPQTAGELADLPGFGPYTTAAVGSLAFGLPLAVLDGNVERVIARLEQIEGDTRQPATKRIMKERADNLLDPLRPGRWNEAMMELGATLCLPRQPRCDDCPLISGCAAKAAERQHELPRRSKGKAIAKVPVLVLLLHDDSGRVLARKPSTGKGMLEGLWELPALDARDLMGKRLHLGDREREEIYSSLLGRLTDEVGQALSLYHEKRLEFKHVYSHFQADVRAIPGRLATGVISEPGSDWGRWGGFAWLSGKELAGLGFSRRDEKVMKGLSG